MGNRYSHILLSFFCFMLFGCNAVAVVGGKTIGVSSGEFIYEDRSLQAIHAYPFDQVWEAAVKTVEEMDARGVVKDRKIAQGTITGWIQDEKIFLNMEYLSEERTYITIRIGIAGDLLSSRLLNEKIGGILKSNKKT